MAELLTETENTVYKIYQQERYSTVRFDATKPIGGV